MDADTDDVHISLFCLSQKQPARSESSSTFNTETTDALESSAAIHKTSLALGCALAAVTNATAHRTSPSGPHTGSMFSLGHLFARICMDNPLSGHPRTLLRLCLSLGGTVKSCAHDSEGLHRGSAVIAFGRIKGVTRRRASDHFTFLYNVSQVCNIKGVLITGRRNFTGFLSGVSLAVKPSRRKWQPNSSSLKLFMVSGCASETPP